MESTSIEQTTELKAFIARIHADFPSAEVAATRADDFGNAWMLDVSKDGKWVIVLWRSNGRIDVDDGNEESVSGSPSQNVFHDSEMAFRRIKQLLSLQSSANTLKELREVQGLTQVDLAHLLGVNQSAVSKLESREGILLESLKNAVEAMGGELEVRAKLPKGEMVMLKSKPRKTAELAV